VKVGYRVDDAGLNIKPPGELKEGTAIRAGSRGIPEVGHRRPMQFNIGLTEQVASLPIVDQGDAFTMRKGVEKRFASAPPKINRNVLRKFKRYVWNQLKSGRFDDPLSSTDDLSKETWLKNRPYPEYRKQELREVEDDIWSMNKDHAKKFLFNKSFMKEEEYPEFKHARGINSRTDAFKVFSGPIFSAIEKKIFSAPEFIKKIPVSERPAYIKNHMEMFGDNPKNSDYTSFEASFVKELMVACELVCYRYYTKNLPNGDLFFSVVSEALTGKNKCIFKFFVAEVRATRMSGDMCTSLGNGFTNLMAIEFLHFNAGYKVPRCIVEGDDSLFNHTGNITSNMFEDLGLIVKMERHTSLNTASFCGLVYHEDDLINITNPKEVLMSFGWLNARYYKSRIGKCKALLRCKALSLLYQYPGAPIFTALARCVLRQTVGVDMRHVFEMRHFNMYEREELYYTLKNCDVLIDKCSTVPPLQTRLLMEDLYGVSVEDQRRIELMLDLNKDLSNFSTGLIFPDANIHNTNEYVIIGCDFHLNYNRKRDICDLHLEKVPPRIRVRRRNRS